MKLSRHLIWKESLEQAALRLIDLCDQGSCAFNKTDIKRVSEALLAMLLMNNQKGERDES